MSGLVTKTLFDVITGEGDAFHYSSNTADTQKRAFFILMQHDLKEAYNNRDYFKIWRIFLEGIEGLSDKMKIQFVEWILDEIVMLEGEIEKNNEWLKSDIIGRYGSYCEKKRTLELKLQEIQKIICSSEFENFFSLIDHKTAERLFLRYLKSDERGKCRYSYTSGVSKILEIKDISQFNADEIIDQFIHILARVYSMDYGSLGYNDAVKSQRDHEVKLILESSIGQSFDIQKAIESSLDPTISYMFWVLLDRYYGEIDWEPIIQKCQKMLDSEDLETQSLGRILIENIAQGPRKL